jgi:capsular exopolysaccharide synthesis family protein
VSLIESSLEKLRQAASGTKSASAAVVREPVAREPVPVLREVSAAPEPRYVHRRITLDLARLRADGYLPDAQQERRFADWCHRVKRPIIERALASGGADDARMLLLTSALPGDGKTFIALNLALSMARERDVSLLLVDGDLPRARISQLLNLQHEMGLLNALRDERMDVESLILDTSVPGLEVLAAGQSPEGATELLASARMREIAQRLVSRNPRRLILFDAPPVLVSTEARALLAIPGQIVLVARAGQTPQQAVVDALTHIDRSKLRGLVVNDAHVGEDRGYYGYDYDYAPPSGAAPAKKA